MRDIEPLMSNVVEIKDRYATLFDCVDHRPIHCRPEDVDFLVRESSAERYLDECLQAFSQNLKTQYRHDTAPYRSPRGVGWQSSRQQGATS